MDKGREKINQKQLAPPCLSLPLTKRDLQNFMAVIHHLPSFMQIYGQLTMTLEIKETIAVV